MLAHPNPIHTSPAHMAFVAATPKWLIIGRTTEIPAAIRTDRRPLMVFFMSNYSPIDSGMQANK